MRRIIFQPEGIPLARPEHPFRMALTSPSTHPERRALDGFFWVNHDPIVEKSNQWTRRIPRVPGPGLFPWCLSSSSFTIQEFVDRIFPHLVFGGIHCRGHPGRTFEFRPDELFHRHGRLCEYIRGPISRIRINITAWALPVWQGLYVAMIGGMALLPDRAMVPTHFRPGGTQYPKYENWRPNISQILCLGSFFGISGAALSGFFTGLGRPWPVMWIHFAMTGLNIAMNYCLIFGNFGFPEMGIRGGRRGHSFRSRLGHALIHSVRRNAAKQRGISDPERFSSGSRAVQKASPFRCSSRDPIHPGNGRVHLVCSFLSDDWARPTWPPSNITFNINMLAFLPLIGAGISTSVLVGKYIGAKQPELAERSVWFRLPPGHGVHHAGGRILSSGALNGSWPRSWPEAIPRK